MLLMILWAAFIALSIAIQYYIIEIEKEYPNKLKWFIIRTLVAAGFFYMFHLQGYWTLWTINFLVFSFWFPFNITLNLLRGKPLLYLSPKNSVVDKWALKIFQHDVGVYSVSLILFINAVVTMAIYGQCTWAAVNLGYCN